MLGVAAAALFACLRSTTTGPARPAVVDVSPAPASAAPLRVDSESARDAGAESPDSDEAARLSKEGRAHFERADYERALECFQAANRIAPRPERLYDIGRALELMGKKNEAADVYEKYLETGLSHTD